MPILLSAALMQAAACTGGLCDAGRLEPVFRKLAGAGTAREPVRIIQIGDSHTAGDQVTGSWRWLLQSRHGIGGRGVLPPGRPYPGYLTRGITASQSAGWRVNGIFGPAYAGDGAPPIGLTGYSLTSAQAGATIGLKADPAQAFNRFTVCALRRPGAGTVVLKLGNRSTPWPLDAAQEEPDCRTLEAEATTLTASVTATGGPVTITSWATEHRGVGGVTLSNLGTVGAQFVHLARTDERVVARELQEYRPDLIVVAFGTNEAFRPGFSAADYDAALRAQLAQIRRLAGRDVPVLLLGAPDSATRLPALQGMPCGGDGGATLPVRAGEMVQPLPAASSSPWRPTAALPVVQATQRRRAHELGLAYWDWAQRMGGRCTADGWANAPVPLMRGDHVHFTTPGAADIAQRLDDDWVAADTAAGGEDTR